MPKHGKRYRAAAESRVTTRLYGVREALEIVRQAATAKFDETVDTAVRLNVDPRHADQIVRGTVNLPHGTGKTIRVLAIAEGDKARFTAVLEEYRKSPEITRRRIYLETMAEILPKLGKKYVIDENSRGVLPLMQLNAGEERK